MTSTQTSIPPTSTPTAAIAPAVQTKDCLPCRLTGAATFGGVGTYALYLAYQDGVFDKVRRKGGSIVGGRLQVLLGLGFLGAGLGRLVI
jgi:hypothetical protein